eukprot:106908-Pelagomonas_calceolata.AAC.5
MLCSCQAWVTALSPTTSFYRLPHGHQGEHAPQMRLALTLCVPFFSKASACVRVCAAAAVCVCTLTCLPASMHAFCVCMLLLPLLLCVCVCARAVCSRRSKQYVCTSTACTRTPVCLHLALVCLLQGCSDCAAVVLSCMLKGTALAEA